MSNLRGKCFSAFRRRTFTSSRINRAFLRSYKILSHSKNSRDFGWIISQKLTPLIVVFNRDRLNRENDPGMTQSLFNSRAVKRYRSRSVSTPRTYWLVPLSHRERKTLMHFIVSQWKSFLNVLFRRCDLFRRLRSCTICKFRSRCNLVTLRLNRLNQEHATAYVYGCNSLCLRSCIRITKWFSKSSRIAHGN